MNNSILKNKHLDFLIVTFIVTCLSSFFIFCFNINKASAFENEKEYDVILDEDNNFVGIDLNSTFNKTLYAGIKENSLLNTGMKFAVLEFKLEDTIFDKENGGLLIQISSLENENWTFMRIYAFVDNIGYNRFFSAHANIPSSRKDNFINEDGSVITVDAVKSKNRCNFPKNVSGTLVIPWADMFDNTAGAITTENPEFRILIVLDVSDDTSANSVGEGILIGEIATYKYVNGKETVVEGLSTKDLTYTNDVDDPSADINIADISMGKKVYCRKKWNDSISVKNYLTDEDKSTTGNIEFRVECPYRITVNYLDEDGNPVVDSRNADIVFDGTDFCYFVNSEIEGYEFLGADDKMALSGKVTENITINLRYLVNGYTNYDIVTDDDGSFYGININESMDGALYFGIKKGASLCEDEVVNAVTEFELANTVYDYENGGLLIQFSTVGFFQFNTQVDIFVNGTNNRFFRVTTGLKSSRTDLCIQEDGTEGSISVSKSAHVARIPANTRGTWIIPWKDMLDNTHGALDGLIAPEMRVAVQTDISMICSQGNEGNGIIIGVIGTYKVDENHNVVFVKGISTKDLDYSYDVDNNERDVNIRDITKGTRVYNRYKWNDSISVRNYLMDTERQTVDKIEYFRSSTVKIKVNYLDENETALSPNGYAQVVYTENGLEYTINAPEFNGYTYHSADKDLSGIVDKGENFDQLEINLKYSKIPQKITLKFVDNNGNIIKEDRIVDCCYNDYIEITPDDIKGYQFDCSSRKLKLTVMNDYTITMTYVKVEGCGGILGTDNILCFLLILALALFVKRLKFAEN